MNRLFVSLTVFFCSLVVAWAQEANDSIRFCRAQHWQVLDKDPRLVVRVFQSKPKDTTSYLFGSPQAVYVVELFPDAFRFGLVQEQNKQKVGRWVARHKALVGLNGGFFDTRTTPKAAAVATDFLKIDGQIRTLVSPKGWGSAAVAFDSASRPHFLYWDEAKKADSSAAWSAPYPHVMAAGPMLVFQGKPNFEGIEPDKSNLTAAERRSRYAPRTAIGVTKEGRVVVLVVDGRRKGAYGSSFAELAAMGRWLGVEYLLNLDGGGSSTLVYKGRLINRPSDGGGVIPLQRKVANGVLVFVK